MGARLNRALAGGFFAVVGAGVAGVCGIEAIQIWRKGTTLSEITAGLERRAPQKAALANFVGGAVIALLAAHFTDTWRIWRP